MSIEHATWRHFVQKIAFFQNLWIEYKNSGPTMAVRQWMHFIAAIFIAFSGALTKELMCMCWLFFILLRWLLMLSMVAAVVDYFPTQSHHGHHLSRSRSYTFHVSLARVLSFCFRSSNLPFSHISVLSTFLTVFFSPLHMNASVLSINVLEACTTVVSLRCVHSWTYLCMQLCCDQKKTNFM